jgi:predicted DNA-binding transcriptional regulator AlpA
MNLPYTLKTGSGALDCRLKAAVTTQSSSNFVLKEIYMSTVDHPSSSIAATLLDKAALANYLSLSVRTLDNLVKKRAVPPGVQIGKRLFWDISVVEKFKERAFGVQRGWRP